MSSKTFITNLKTHQDIDELSRKSDEVIALTKGSQPPTYANDQLKVLMKGLSQFDTKEDSIVPAGGVLMAFLAGIAVGLKSPDKVKLHVFDSKTEHYKKVMLNVTKALEATKDGTKQSPVS